MRKFTTWLFCLSISMTQPAIAQVDTAKLTLDTLKNGLQLMIYSDSALQMAATRLSFLAGSRFDQADQAGVAYLAHHLMQNELAAPQGFPRDPTMTNYLTGGTISTTFTEDRSIYCQEFLPEEMKLALAVEARRLSPVHYASERINEWRNAIAQQEKLAMGTGKKDKYQQFVQQAVFSNPYDRPVQGFADLLESSTNDEIKEFVRKHYTSNSASLIIVSPVPVDTVQKLVNALFRGWPRGQASVERESWVSIPPDSIRADTFHDHSLVLPIVTYLFSLPPATDSSFRATQSVGSMLFDGKDALITQLLRKKGLGILQAGFDLKANSGGAVASYSIVPKPGQAIDSISHHLDSLLHEFAEENLPDRDFFLWQAKMQKQHRTTWRHPGKIAMELSWLNTAGMKPAKSIPPSKEGIREIVKSCFAAHRKKVFIALDSDR